MSLLPKATNAGHLSHRGVVGAARLGTEVTAEPPNKIRIRDEGLT